MCKHCFQRKSCFKKHIRGHFIQDNSSKINQTEVQEGNAIGKQTENRAASPDINHINETDETSTIAERKDSVDRWKELTQHKCPFCGKLMLKRNIPRHCREKHNEEIVNAATCVDMTKGIYLVCKSTHGGVVCHIKKDL